MARMCAEIWVSGVVQHAHVSCEGSRRASESAGVVRFGGGGGGDQGILFSWQHMYMHINSISVFVVRVYPCTFT